MNTDSKKIEDYLHLYLGCEALATESIYSRTDIPFEITGVDLKSAFPVKCSDSLERTFSIIKPILRPLSDMTEEEELEYTQTINKWNFGRNMKGAAESVRYFLSKHFDLFGLIESGLAIDKTKHPIP